MADRAAPFVDMASRISKIDVTEFAGAVVVVPPSGEPIAFLTTDPDPNIAQFWSGLLGRLESAAAQAKDEQERAASPPGYATFRR